MTNSPARHAFFRFLVIWFAALFPAALRAQESPPPGWSFELGEAFADYHAGHFSKSAEICRAVAATAKSETVRRDAEALAAMTSMRMGTREECTSGRTRLGQVLRSDSRILDRPDARFALGLARLTLNETSAALGELLGALEGFERQQRTPRVLEALVAVADCWSRFNEWGLPVRGLPLAPPDSPEAAAAERTKRIAEFRAKAETIAGGESAVARIDVIVARQMLQRDESRSDGIARLQELVKTKDLAVSTEAAMILAEQLAGQGAAANAILPLYQFVASANLGEKSRQAQQAAEELLRRKVDFVLPAVIKANEPALARAAIANFTGILFEARRFDIAEFLTRNKGMLIESQLPDDGALVASGPLNRPDGSVASRWTADIPLKLPAGAFVILARDAAAPTGAAIGKALLLVDSLEAAVIVGNQQALVAANAAAACKARFWMHGSFQPVEITLTNGSAVFALPPESRLVTDRRWVCLVQSDFGTTAVCRGTLPETPLREKGGAGVLLSAAPESPRVAEEVLVSGWLADGLAPGAPPLRLDVELRDTLDELREKRTVTVDATGAFAAKFSAAVEWAGATIHPVIRHQGAVLPCLFRIPLIRLNQPTEIVPLIDAELGLLGIAQEGLLRGNLRARYPWATPLLRGRADMRFRAVRLPDSEMLLSRLATPTVTLRSRLDTQGRAIFAQPTAAFSLEAGKVAINAHFDVFGPESAGASRSIERLFSEESVHLWLDPFDQPCIAGRPVSLRVGWYDPSHQLGGVQPTLELRAPADREFTAIPLFPDRGGYWTADWFPCGPGMHLARATLPRLDGSLQEAIVNIPVESAAPHAQAETVSFQAALEQDGSQYAIRVLAATDRNLPILATVLADQPLSGAWLGVDRNAGTRIALSRVPASGVNVALFTLEGGELRCLGARWLAGPSNPAIRIVSADPEISPGKVARFEVASTAGDLRGASVIARLVDLAESGSVNWLLSEQEIDSASPRFSLTSGNSANRRNASDALPLPSVGPIPSQAALSMSRGMSLWTEVERAAGEKAVFTIPLPAAPGRYRLSATARWRDGRQATALLPLDLSQSTAISADLPAVLFAGDRSVASIHLENPSDQPRSAHVRVTPGACIALENWRLAGGPSSAAPKEEGGSIAIDLMPRSEAILTANFEAARAGRGVFQLSLESGSQNTRIERAYRVMSTTETPQSNPSKETLPVIRKIYRVDTALPDPEELDPDQKPTLPRPSLFKEPRMPLAELESTPLGTILLVEDTIEFQRPMTNIEWIQRAPSLAALRDESDNSAHAIAPVASFTAREATYRQESLAPGKYTHRFLLVTRRPGVCLLPGPLIRATGETFQIRTEPLEPRIRSVD